MQADTDNLFDLPLFANAETPVETTVEPDVDVERVMELINRRRRQILVHSAAYYRLNASLIPDSRFDSWCRELVELQASYPELAQEAVFADLFADFDGSTGFHLAGAPWAVEKAMQLVKWKTTPGGR